MRIVPGMPDPTVCTWCEENAAVLVEYDEHNGEVRWCHSCYADRLIIHKEHAE